MTKLARVRLNEEQLAAEMSAIPMKRGAPPEEIAEAVLKIADTPFLTGEIVNLNGGVFMRP